jgi:hypothetical protein
MNNLESINTLNGLINLNCDYLNAFYIQNVPGDYFNNVRSNIQNQIDNLSITGGQIESITVGTVQSLNPDAQPYVNITGTTQNIVLNFGLVRGYPGERGERGERGESGGGGGGNALNPDAQPYVTITGTTQNIILNFGLVRGYPGERGERGESGGGGGGGGNALDDLFGGGGGGSIVDAGMILGAVAAIGVIQAQIGVLQAQIAVLQGQIVVIQGQIAALQAQITAINTEITTINASIVNLEEDSDLLLERTALQSCDAMSTTFTGNLIAESFFADSVNVVNNISCLDINNTGNVDMGTPSVSTVIINGSTVDINALTINLNGIVSMPLNFFNQW